MRHRPRPVEPALLLARFHEALLSDLELRPVLRNILQVATEALEVHQAAVFLYHPETAELRGEVASDRTVSTLALPLVVEGVVQQAFFAPEEGMRVREDHLLPIVVSPSPAGGKPFCWTDPRRLCALTPKVEPERRAGQCPSCPHFGAIGVLSLEGQLPPQTRRLLPLLARSTALAVRNARVYEESKARQAALAEQGEFLHLLAQITRETLEHDGFEALMQTLVARIAELFGADSAHLALWDETSRSVRPVVAHGISSALYRGVRPQDGEPTLTEHALRLGRPLAVEDVLDSPYISPRLARLFPTRSALVLPLIAQGRPLGAVIVGFHSLRSFRPEEIAKAQQAAELIALAMLKARLLADEGRRQRWFRALLENSHDVVYVLDEAGLLIYVSPNARSVLGYDPEGYRSAPIQAMDFLHPDDRPKAAELFDRLRQKPETTLRAELRLLDHRGQAIWAEVWGRNLLADPAVGGLVLNVRDIAEQKRAERAKNEFIASVSHELRTPLTAIMGFTELMLESEPDPHNAQMLQISYENGVRLRNMISNLLDASKLDAGHFEVLLRPARLEPTLLEAARAFEGVARLSQVVLEVDLPPLPAVQADLERLAQVVGNLLSNAFKFTPRGGMVRLTAASSAAEVSIQIEDTGAGIPPAEQAKLFQRFGQGRTEAARGMPGTGLGLFISRVIVEAHGGRIGVESRVGRGTTFTVTLPCAQTAG
ncbi:MAG: ATP-binding protein [Meiothermus sp.]|nr:ATP-binding protein [Meiothermus sp.]